MFHFVGPLSMFYGQEFPNDITLGRLPSSLDVPCIQENKNINTRKLFEHVKIETFSKSEVVIQRLKALKSCFLEDRNILAHGTVVFAAAADFDGYLYQGRI